MSINTFDWSQLLSLKESAALYNREESTLKRAITNGKLVEGVDCKKFGRDWVILRSSLERVYILERRNLKKS